LFFFLPFCLLLPTPFSFFFFLFFVVRFFYVRSCVFFLSDPLSGRISGSVLFSSFLPRYIHVLPHVNPYDTLFPPLQKGREVLLVMEKLLPPPASHFVLSLELTDVFADGCSFSPLHLNTSPLCCAPLA